MSGTLLQFKGDIRSSGYLPPYIGAIHGWLVTTSHIYRIEDIFGTTTLIEQHEFAIATSHRSLDFSREVSAGRWGVCASYYRTGNTATQGTWVVYTSDGGQTWSEQVKVSGKVPHSSRTHWDGNPGCFISPRTEMV